MSGILLLSPLLVRFVSAMVLMFAWRQIHAQRIISIIMELLAVVLSIISFKFVLDQGPVSMQAGGWLAPYGISLVLDALSALLLLITSVIGFGVSLFAGGSMLNSRLRFGFYPIFHLLLLGISGSFMAGDIFNLYVWFEVMIISSFVLLTLGGERGQIEGAVKYFTLNFLASVVFLTGLAVLYGLTGSLNMADLSLKLPLIAQRSLVDVCALIFLVAFGIKAAVFPLYFWLPAAYHTPPTAVTAVFGGLLTKVGIYAMLRVFTLIFPWNGFLSDLFELVAVLTILAGALGALSKFHLVKALSWLIVCHIGFMLAGLAVHNEQAVAGTVFYMTHDMLVKTTLFLMTGITYRLIATHLFRRAGGLYANHPGWSLLFALPLFALVGIPPLSGFWPKVSLLGGMAASNEWLLFAMVLLGSFATLVVAARIWIAFFWNAGPIEQQEGFRYFTVYPKFKQQLMILGYLVLFVSTILVAVSAPKLYAISNQIAKDLLSPDTYLELVLPGIQNHKP